MRKYLAAKTQQADKALAEAWQALTQAAEIQPDNHRATDDAPCRMPAQERVASAEVALAEAQAQQTQAQAAIQAISRTYHPYPLDTAQPQSRAAVEQRLAQAFDHLEQLAETAALSPRCGARLAKARRVLTDRLATVTFFIMTVTARIEALDLAPAVASAVLNQLLPALSLQRVAERTQTASERQRLQQHATVLLNSLNAPESPLTGLPSEQRALIEQVTTECADLFQRSRSCVEGRNGQLALHHHHLHRIRPRKLTALTTVHNSFIRRPDGTTPAERLFGSRPADLFEWLLDHVPMPARPARKRASPSAEKPLLRAVA